MSVVLTIVKANYAATTDQIETLARDVVRGRQADGTYLRVLIVACQAKMKRKSSAGAQLALIDHTHERYYAAVLRGVGSGSMSTQDRHRRSTFARTAASTLRGFVNAGGNIRSLVAAKTTKSKLRNFGQPVPTGTRPERIFQQSALAVIRAAKRMLKDTPETARLRISTTIEALQEMAAKLPKKRAGEPALHSITH